MEKEAADSRDVSVSLRLKGDGLNTEEEEEAVVSDEWDESVLVPGRR